MYSKRASAEHCCTGARKDGQPCRAYAAWGDVSLRIDAADRWVLDTFTLSVGLGELDALTIAYELRPTPSTRCLGGWRRLTSVSKGPGRLMRRIVELLEQEPGHKMSRAELVEALVKGEGFDGSNVLRSVKLLEKMHLVLLHEGPGLDRSFVTLLHPTPEPVSESKMAELLAEIGGWG